ncbi:unnamed protein product, partial [Rotaria magnacalcarata]
LIVSDETTTRFVVACTIFRFEASAITTFRLPTTRDCVVVDFVSSEEFVTTLRLAIAICSFPAVGIAVRHGVVSFERGV